MTSVLTRRNLLFGAAAVSMLAIAPLPAAAITLAQAQENYRSAGARLRTAKKRYAAGRIKKSTLQRRQNEYDEAARVLKNLQGGSRPSTNQSSSGSSSRGSANRTLTVRNSSQLKKALGSAGPGTEIRLMNGKYGGSYTLSNSGKSRDPIVIKAANKHRATLTGLLRVKGNHCWVSELTFQPGYVEVTGSDTKILRCHFRDVKTTSITVRPPSRRAEIGYNEFRNFGGTGSRGRGISLRPNSSSRWSAQTHIHHNYLRDQRGNDGVIGIGIAPKNTKTAINALVEWNLIENARGQAVYLKSSSNTVRFNTVRQSKKSGDPSGFQSRHGSRNEFIANASINAGGVLLRGKQHRAIGNYKDDRRRGVWIDHCAPTGTVTEDKFMSARGTQWPPAEDCVFIGNIGRMIVGGGSGSHKLPARGTVIKAHKGPVRLNGGRQAGTRDNRNGSAGVKVPRYKILTQRNVGPNA